MLGRPGLGPRRVVQPPHPRRLAQAGRLEEPDRAGREVGPGLVERLHHHGVRRRGDHVVGVGEREEVAADVPLTLVAGRAQAAVGGVHDADPGMPGGVGVGERAGAVGRAVVDDHDLQVLVRRREDAVEAFGEVGGHVVDGHHHAHQRPLVLRGATPELHAQTVVPDSITDRDRPRRHRARGLPAQGAVRRRRRAQRHQHDGRVDADPRPARAAARGRRRRDQPQGVRRAALGGRPPRPAAQGGRGPGQRRAAGRVVRGRPDRHPRARADQDRRVAGRALLRGRRAGGQGPAAELVPVAVAGRRDPRGRDPRLRDDAAPARRGGRQQADLLRQQAGRRAPDGVVAQHAAAHRARDP